MSIPTLYSNVISGLLKKSQSKQVRWNTTTDANTFIVFFDKTSLSIRQNSRIDFNGNLEECWIIVDLLNDLGEKVDGFVIEGNDEDWDKLDELYTLARRAALSIDSAIHEIITEINKTGIIGKKINNNSSNGDDSFTDDIPF